MPEAELPSTDEADALDSRYLMPSDRERPAPRRRTRGPEFADAEFPTDALLDAEADALDLTLPQPAPVAETRPSGRFAAPSAEPEPAPSACGASQCGTRRSPGTCDARQEDEQEARGRPPRRNSSAVRSDRPSGANLPCAACSPACRWPCCSPLGVQAVHQFRDVLAAQHPSWRDALTRWCELAHCTLQPPLRIDALQVDSATLLRADSAGPDHYRLSVVVRNRAALALAWPHVDLTLTDISGAVVARRSFSPADAQWADGSDSPPRFAPRPDAVPPAARHHPGLAAARPDFAARRLHGRAVLPLNPLPETSHVRPDLRLPGL